MNNPTKMGDLGVLLILRPGPLCCPEIYRDVPGKFHDDDDDDDDDWRS